MNLAEYKGVYVFAQQVDTRVIVVECDLRRPHVHSALKLAPTPGLTNFLNNECSADDIIKTTKLPNMNAVCYGAVPPNPSELLASDAMADLVKQLESEYDYIIFDTPPIGVVIDSVPILKMSDGVVVVVNNNSTTYPQLSKTIDIINRSGGKIIGTIINRVKPVEGKKYKKGYGGYSYGYYGY